MGYTIEMTHMESGEVLPFLYTQNPYQPVLLPLLYVMLDRRYRALNTIKSDVSVLRYLYTWADEKVKINLEERLLSGETLTYQELQMLATWLRSGRVASNVVGRIGRSKDLDTFIHPQTFNTQWGTIKRFLLFAHARYGYKQSGIDGQFHDLQVWIESAFDSAYMGGKSVNKEKGLEPEEVEKILTLIHPNNPDNPFRPQLRLRNWIIVRLLLDTGLRKGELLKLLTTDVQETGNNYTVHIKRRPDDPTDTRRTPPGQKTDSRHVAIKEYLFEQILEYITSSRRPLRNGKPMKLSHTYLFTSEQGKPLDATQINYITATIKAHLFPEDFDLHPHIFRNTFAINFLTWCIDEKKMGMELAKDQLRAICGWSKASTMPLKYAEKWNRVKANAMNLKRQEDAWAKLKESD